MAIVEIIPPNTRGNGPYRWQCIRCGQIVPDQATAIEASLSGCPTCGRRRTIELAREVEKPQQKAEQLTF